VNRRRLIELIEACQDLSLDAPAAAELAAELKRSPRARAVYWECFELHNALHAALQEEARAASATRHADGSQAPVEAGRRPVEEEGSRAEAPAAPAAATALRGQSSRLDPAAPTVCPAPGPAPAPAPLVTVPSSGRPGEAGTSGPGRAARAGRGGRWPLAVIAAAAALIVAVSGLHVAGLLPTHYATVELFNVTGAAPLERELPDGTLVTVAPGAKAEARGRDDARGIRQLILLTEGGITVRAPKAPAGQTAVRVETPEGLWVETVGTVFTVKRAWENEKGERNVDRKKLTGIAAAVLLVAVSEGEVRTGSARAEETRVAAGKKTVVRAGEAGETMAWGQAAGGLRLGLLAARGRARSSDSLELEVRIQNSRSDGKDIAFPAGAEMPALFVFSRKDGKDVPRAPVFQVADKPVLSTLDTRDAGRLAGGHTISRRFKGFKSCQFIDARGMLYDIGARSGAKPLLRLASPLKSLAPGAYSVQLFSQLSGKGKSVSSGLATVTIGGAALATPSSAARQTLVLDASFKSRKMTDMHLRTEVFTFEVAKVLKGDFKGRTITVAVARNGRIDRLCRALGSNLKGVPPPQEGRLLRLTCELTGARPTGSTKVLADRYGVNAELLSYEAAWGQPSNGLQGRIEVKKETIAPGEDIQLTFALRTAPDQKKPLYVWDNKYSEGYRNDSYIVKTPEGKKITLRLPGDREWRKNVPHPVQIKPGAPHTLQGWTGATKSLKKLGLDTSNPGVYTIRGVYQQAGGNNNRGVAMWGGRLTTPAVEVRVGKPAGGIAWGKAVAGLQAGLSAKKTRFTAGEPLQFTVHVRNNGKQPLTLNDGAWPYNWSVSFAPSGGGHTWHSRCLMKFDRAGLTHLKLGAGESRTVALQIGGRGMMAKGWQFETEPRPDGKGGRMAPSLPPGKYTVTAGYTCNRPAVADQFWQGQLTTGTLAIEILAAPKPKISWGKPSEGLKLGLVIGATRIARDAKTMPIEVHHENIGSEPRTWHAYSTGAAGGLVLHAKSGGRSLIRLLGIDTEGSGSISMPDCTSIGPGSERNRGLEVDLPLLVTNFRPGEKVQVRIGECHAFLAQARRQVSKDHGKIDYRKVDPGDAWEHHLTRRSGVVEVEIAAAPAARGAWTDMVHTEAEKRAYARLPGKEQVLRGRLSALRPITELRDYAYELRLPAGKRFTLASGIYLYLDMLAAAALASGLVDVRGKLEKNVTLFKAEPEKGVVLHPSALRTGRLMVVGELKHFPAGVKSREAWLGHGFKVMGVAVLPTRDVPAAQLMKHVGTKVQVSGYWDPGKLWTPSGGSKTEVNPLLPEIRRKGGGRRGYGLAASRIRIVDQRK